MKNKEHINKDNLNKLLNTYSLNKHSVEEDVDMAKTVFDKEYEVDMSEADKKKLLKKLGGSNNKWPWFGVLLILIVVSIVAVYQFEEKIPDPNTATIEGNLMSESTKEPTELISVLELNEIISDTSFMKTYTAIKDSVVDTIAVNPIPYDQEPIFMKEASEQVALFSESDKERYQKLKQEMVAELIATNKEAYTQVRESYIYYKKKKIGVDAFILRNFSITNMEYKAFLVDLIQSNSQEALGVTSVNQEVWLSYNCNDLANNYFKEKAYDGFPVVNISPQAALLFCKWLEAITNKQLLLDNPKAKTIRLRLPYDDEWISAAKIGFAQTPVCDGYQTIFDITEGLVNKSFLKRQVKVQKHDLKDRTSLDNYFDMNRYGMTESDILNIFKNTDTIKVHYPDGLKNIAKVAHVSEFIQNDEGKVIVFGSCWKSKEEYSEMLNAFKNKSASPFIGFRFVVENDQLETYKNPFW